MDARQQGTLIAAARRAFPLLSGIDTRGYLVGGAVRDLILGREPRDADIAIEGATVEAQRFARHCGGRAITLGSEPFDIVRVAAGGVVYDFAEIVGRSIQEDLERRDFTIGAMAVPLDGELEVIDPYDGAGDLVRRSLRMIRESNFGDDPLRVLRGARLVAELGLSIDGATHDAMRRHTARVAEAAPERLGVEWLALLSAGDGGALRVALELVRALGLDRLLTGGGLSEAAIQASSCVEDADPVSRLAAIALDADEATLCETSLRLGFGASRVDALRAACRVVRQLRDRPEQEIDPVALHDGGAEATRRAITVLRVRGAGEVADRVAELVARDGERIFSARPLLDGHAIVAITGIEPGPRIGAIRRALLVAQLRGEVCDESQALAFVKNTVLSTQY